MNKLRNKWCDNGMQAQGQTAVEIDQRMAFLHHEIEQCVFALELAQSMTEFRNM